MFDIPMNSKPPMSLSDMANMQSSGTQQNQVPQQNFNQQPMQQSGFNQAPQQNFGDPQQNFGGQMNQQSFNQQSMSQGGFNQAPQQQAYQQQSYQAPMQQAAPAMQSTARPQGGGVILKKGQKTSLTRMNPSLDLIEVGLGWDLAPGGAAYDLDVEAFLLGQSGKVIGDDWFVFYNQPTSPDGSVRLLQDSTTGAGAGDDEIIQVKLSQVNPNVAKIIFIVTINEAKERGYNFSNVQNAYVRIVDKSTNNELLKFNLTDYYNTVCSMMVGEVYKHNGEWRFNPIGDGTGDDLFGLCARYGVNVAG